MQRVPYRINPRRNMPRHILINSRISEAEEQIGELEDKMVEITSDRQNRVKRAEDSLRDLWDHIKCTNIQIIGVPEEEEKKERV